MGTILGAKNTAVNTAHEQARVAMLQMVQDLHSAISLPYLIDTDASGNVIMDATGAPALTTGPQDGPAAGIAFQQWSMGPIEIKEDTAPLPGSQNFVKVKLASNSAPVPTVGQRLIIPTHQIEGDITQVSGKWDDLKLTLANMPAPSPAPSAAPSPAGTLLPVRIQGTTSGMGDVVGFVADRCWYVVANNVLVWHKQGTRIMVNDITSQKPFSTPTTAAGALYYRFVAAIDLSTADMTYTNRDFKSANILLNGQVPMRARLTTYQ
jgi:hypothetical protein